MEDRQMFISGVKMSEGSDLTGNCRLYDIHHWLQCCQCMLLYTLSCNLCRLGFDIWGDEKSFDFQFISINSQQITAKIAEMIRNLLAAIFPASVMYVCQRRMLRSVLRYNEFNTFVHHTYPCGWLVTTPSVVTWAQVEMRTAS